MIANLVEWVVVGVLLLSVIGWVPVLGIVLAPYVAGGAIGDPSSDGPAGSLPPPPWSGACFLSR
jgi:hypothetical protein